MKPYTRLAWRVYRIALTSTGIAVVSGLAGVPEFGLGVSLASIGWVLLPVGWIDR